MGAIYRGCRSPTAHTSDIHPSEDTFPQSSVILPIRVNPFSAKAMVMA
jgi:hypothetical protein